MKFLNVALVFAGLAMALPNELLVSYPPLLVKVS